MQEILKTLISLGKGIEINTGGIKYGLGHPNPTEAILKRYRELGGEIITIGADGHKPEHVAYDFDKVPPILKEAGFEYYTVFRETTEVYKITVAHKRREDKENVNSNNYWSRYDGFSFSFPSKRKWT